MIRDKTGIRKVFPIFWKECRICRKEFKLERGWKVVISGGTRPVEFFICQRCAPSFEEVRRFTERIRNSRPPGPPGPPPAPSPLMYRRKL